MSFFLFTWILYIYCKVDITLYYIYDFILLEFHFCYSKYIFKNFVAVLFELTYSNYKYFPLITDYFYLCKLSFPLRSSTANFPTVSILRVQ